jgi:hypothetical protein
MRRQNQRWALLPVLLTVLAAGGCGDPEAEAREYAAGRTRQTAADAKAAFAAQLQEADGSAEGDDALRERVRAALEIQTQPASLGRSLEIIIEPGRQVVARMVFFGHGEAGGGWTKESYNVRLCAVLRGTPGPDPAVEMENLDCPADLEPYEPNIGTVLETIPLSD